ncbi:MAG: hypothetical protein MUF87_08475 [Anaerolineae bacterium]|nr:hypothetical protein [Anaerolineae bacterium]
MRFLTLSMVGLLLMFFIASQNHAQTGPCLGDVDLNYGETWQEEINNQEYFFFACFEGELGDRVVIMSERISGNLDTFLFLASADFSDIYVSNDDLGLNTFDSWIEYVLPANGNYLIGISRFGLDEGNTQGEFRLSLHLEDLQDGRLPESLDGRALTGINLCEEADLIAYGDTVTGEITPSNTLIPFCFQATAGDRVRIEMTPINGSRLSPFIVLEEATLTQRYQTSGEARRSRVSLEYTFSEGDLYLISAMNEDDSYGEFELTLTLISTGNLGGGRRTHLDLKALFDSR